MNEQAFPGEGINKPNRILIGEPVTLPDGRVLSLYKTEMGINVSCGGWTSYTDEEVEEIGLGFWDRGLVKISQAYYTEPLFIGNLKHFSKFSEENQS